MNFCYRLGMKPNYRSKMQPWNAVTAKRNTATYVVNFHNLIL